MTAQIVDFHDEDFHSYTIMNSSDVQVCRFEVANVYGDKGAIWGEVSVWYLFDGEPDRPVFKHKRVNLLTDKRPGIDDLADRANVWPWDEWYEVVGQLTVDAHRAPTPVTALIPTPDDGVTAPFLIEPFVLSRGVSLMFGPGGTGKSLLALAYAIATVSGRTVLGRQPSAVGPVIYIDYEDTQAVHELRLNALLEGLEMTEDDLLYPILYLKPRQSITKMRRELHQHHREIRPALVIVDSVGLGRGGDAMGSEETIRFFQTLNTLPTAVLCIDHMTKDDTRSGKMLTPYGSVYTVNSVRLAWAVSGAETSTPTEKYLTLKQTKRNNVAYHPPMGVEIDFENHERSFGEGDLQQQVLSQVRVTLNDREWEADPGFAIDRAWDYLEANGPRTSKEISDALQLVPDSMTRALKRAEGVRVRRLPDTRPPIWDSMNRTPDTNGAES